MIMQRKTLTYSGHKMIHLKKANLFVMISAIIIFLMTFSLPTPGHSACTDNDGDGYGNGDTCLGPDCNDGNAAVHPGASERCNFIDDNCDSIIDEGFIVGKESPASATYDCGDIDSNNQPIDNDGDGNANDADPDCQAAYCFFFKPDGCNTLSPAEQAQGKTPNGANCCTTRSFYTCTADGLAAYCPVPLDGNGDPAFNLPGSESPYTASCHDDLDNDCDNYSDAADSGCVAAERCNGLDDDYDELIDEDFTYSGGSLGDTCTVGIGACQRTGTVICTTDTLGATCTASAATPGIETIASGKCNDAIDNDCDGITDLADSGCQEAEKCDGIDNDGDGLIDEDFTALGSTCSAGLGDCLASGVQVCSLDGTGTVCNAVPQLAGIEGPTGPTCYDGLDNDCDGQIDALDSNCGSSDLSAWCALPYTVGQPGDDCTGKHQILFQSTNAGPDAIVTAELLALDVNGNIMDSRIVQNGDLAHLASRLGPGNYKFASKTNKQGTVHTVFAPVPMLRVTVQDGLNKVQAYCSNIPYLQVIEPQGKVVRESDGDVTHVFTAIPLVDPSSLVVKVDGVDVFSALGKNPEDCTLISPCTGSYTVNGQTIMVSEIAVQASPVALYGSNMFSMDLTNLGCGGHIVTVQGGQMPGQFTQHPNPQCNKDDLYHAGLSSTLGVKITTPAAGENILVAPVTVTGKACSGREIAGVDINGKSIDVSGQTVTLGDGVNSADSYELQINASMGLTDVIQVLSTGKAPLGTFERGQNRFISQVTDDLGNRSFKSFFFSVGDVSAPGVGPLSTSSIMLREGPPLVSIYGEAIQETLDSITVDIENSFVAGLNPDSVQTLFSEKCSDAQAEFESSVRANIAKNFPFKRTAPGGCSCDPPVWIYLDSVQFQGNLSCPVTFNTDDKFHVAVNLPDVIVNIHADGWCKVTDDLFGICWAETVVKGPATTTISNIKLDFDVTENQIMGSAGPEPIYTSGNGVVVSNITSDVNCVAAACNFAGEFFLTALTFGIGGWIDLSPDLDVTKDIEFKDEIDASEPDPVKMGEMTVGEEEVSDFGVELKGTLADVQITPQGIVAKFTGQFSTTLPVDPAIEGDYVAALTPAHAPALPVTDAGDAFVVISDDVLNQFFASLTASGGLQTGCQSADPPVTIASLLPDCNTLIVGECSNDSSRCFSNAQCGTGNTCNENPLLTVAAKGACHAFKGTDCSTLSAFPLQKLACEATATQLSALNISTISPLMFCAKQDNPPTIKIHDDTSTSWVETALQLNDLNIALLIDKTGNGADGEFTSIPNCGSDTATASGDCNFLSACLDLYVETEMKIASKYCANDRNIDCTSNGDCVSVGGTCVNVCDGNKPGFVTRVKNIVPSVNAVGVPCGGSSTTGDDDLVNQIASSDKTNNVLLNNATQFTPPTCMEGFTLGGTVNLTNPKLLTIEVNGTDDTQDYIGITGNIIP